ncbi:pirin family protein [Actinomarinicola tropica]|uniref:Pirin family protein n=1 Tax=Actinomarinicola tropica TaxID=2789776 RepID=A0A5Q2RA05_9ACTN|nr:pirin family protein [Actinomarinicola tropica]QGG93668.1 pirin family protein [Actinomarinicola tropica]
MSGPVTTHDAPVDDEHDPPERPCVERHEAREVDLGGMRVRRTLPKRQRRTVGAWCFADHFGPSAPDAPMQVGPHPHIGLQTVTWLLEGEVLHHDSLGTEQLIRPGQLNLMTAGNGIAHAEETPASAASVQHGVQLWVAQPEATRHGAPAFEHHAELPTVDAGGWGATVLVGALGDVRSAARTDTPLVGVALSCGAAVEGTLPAEPTHEHALVVMSGAVRLGDEVVRPGEIAYLGLGRDELALGADGPTEALLLGGEPFPDELAMWWNFVGRDRDELRRAREDWESGHERFGEVSSVLDRVPAPPHP